MKRPLPIFIVALWCFIGLLIQVNHLSTLVVRYLGQEQTPEVQKTLSGAGGILVIWHVVLLIQLKPFNRWVSTVFFLCWTVSLIWNTFVFVLRLETSFRPVAILLTIAAFNVTSIWYLVRRSFRDFSVQFVSERERERNSRIMQKISQKRIQSGR